jgi:NADH-quinone oxidoreductase subunit G
MVRLTIDGIRVEVPEGTTILNAAKSVGVVLPTLCYMKDINDIGACRICVAEIEGRKKLVTTCNTPVSEGMVVMTNSPRAREARRVNVQFILSQHDCNCPTCIRSTNCSLQKIANDLGIISQPYTKEVPEKKWDITFPLIKDDSKCIKCMRCIQVCSRVQSIGVWGLDNTGSRTTIGVSCDREINESDASLRPVRHPLPTAPHERTTQGRAFGRWATPTSSPVVQFAPPSGRLGARIWASQEIFHRQTLVPRFGKSASITFSTRTSRRSVDHRDGTSSSRKFPDAANTGIRSYSCCRPDRS